MKTVRLALLGVVLFLAAPGLAKERLFLDRDGVDVFAQALRRMGITEADLGYRPPAHFARYPHPKTTPHLLPFFEDLLARPLDTYSFTRELGNTVEDYLTPERLLEPPDEKSRKETLFRLGVLLGTDRLIGGFRGYSANLDPRPEAVEPLRHALTTLLERSGKPLRRPMAFGGDYGTKTQTPEAGLRAELAKVPEPLHLPLAKFILNLVQAREWIDLGLRRVTPKMREEVFAALGSLAAETPDGTGYHPVFDDVARVLDAPSLYYGCLKALQAVQDARREFEAVEITKSDEWPKTEFKFRLETPWGDVLFQKGSAETAATENPFLVVSFGGYGEHTAPLGATGPDRTLSVALVLPAPWDTRGLPAQFFLAPRSFCEAGLALDPPPPARLASGILGCGIVYSAGDHGDDWETGSWGLGCGVFGLGALVDEGGNDRYVLSSVGQGAGFFGIGLLLDAAGNDEYRLREGDGQGYGGPGGVGVLADRSGDDSYYSEPLASEAGRADYHSAGEIAVSNAQGVGSGRRGDGSDGHNWAGGLGALLDVDGNDRYRAGNFSQGLGYWYGTGLLWDGGGHDEYRSVYFTQGSGAHFAVGALIDESGNDLHVLGSNAGAAYGFGWDVVNAFLIDRGNGNDRYLAKIISTGLAEVRSNAFFLDEGGDDLYVLAPGSKGFGDVDERETYTEPGRTYQYPFHLGQVGVFLDLGGKDRYLRRKKDGTLTPDEEAGDRRTWNLRRHPAGAPHGPNVSVGIDVPGGRLGFLDPWPARKPE